MIYLSNAFSINMLDPDKTHTITIHPAKKHDIAKMLKDHDFISGIGHPDIAAIIASDLGIDAPMNRINIKLTPSDLLIVAQYIGPRLSPGTTTLPADATIKYFIIRIS